MNPLDGRQPQRLPPELEMIDAANIVVAVFAAVAAGLMLVTKLVEYKAVRLRHRPGTNTTESDHILGARRPGSIWHWWSLTFGIIRIVVMISGVGLIYYTYQTADATAITRREFYWTLLIVVIVLLYAIPSRLDE